MARIILLNGPPVNTHFKKNLHAFKNLAAKPGPLPCPTACRRLSAARTPAIGGLEVGFLYRADTRAIEGYPLARRYHALFATLVNPVSYTHLTLPTKRIV